MAPKTIVAPSLLAADHCALGADAKRAEDLGADWLHFDVMASGGKCAVAVSDGN
jgi:ribulose-phosphate 3-epimerase